ncbi:hypothetical protein [Stenotrophomonas sp.]|uniref:hypothetical protein n=1 Tax=Stenotrophomonas sp. TaxID=69392 RepID=UPI0028A89F12|nr:hypothetical protein [Stenotrophomonas sp.]
MSCTPPDPPAGQSAPRWQQLLSLEHSAQLEWQQLLAARPAASRAGDWLVASIDWDLGAVADSGDAAG